MPRMQLRHAVLVLTLLLSSTACAGTGTATSDPADRTGRNSSVLQRDEMETAQVSNLYDVVERLRPRWLQVRSVSSLGQGDSQIVVFLNTKYLGGPEVLREFQASSVTEIRYLDGPRASATLQGFPDGRHVAGGIVLVTTPVGR